MRRCSGVTRNFHRCGREGNWKLFCDDHRFQPIGWIVFFVFTILGGAASIQSAWFPHLWTEPSLPVAVPTAIAPEVTSTAVAKTLQPTSVAAEQKRVTHKVARVVLPTVVVNNAPNGIAIGGGIVTNPTVNNYGPPSRRLTADEKNNLRAAVTGSKARVIIWFFVGDDTPGVAQDLYDVFYEAGWEMAAAHPEAALQAEPQKVDINLFLPASSATEPASASAIAVIAAMKASWMHLSVAIGRSVNVPEGSVKLVVGPRWVR